jgi:N-acetylmuramoyl-L-alanine amidase
MDAPAPDRAKDHPDFVTRRQLLWLAGGAGLAATVGGCAHTASSSPPAKSTAPTDPTVQAVPPPSAPPPAPAAVPMSTAAAQLLCRDAWGAQPPRPGGKPHTITRMTLHHEAVVLADNRNAPGRLRQDQHYHQDQLGWIDIAYHVGVDRNGNIYELRSPTIAGDTATDYNTTGHFLVLCEGDFDREVATEAQIDGAALAFAWAAQNFAIATNTLAGHRDVAQTSCPGANLYAHLASGDLKHRIDDLLAGGRVDLQLFCGPDAAARVGSIEAGN